MPRRRARAAAGHAVTSAWAPCQRPRPASSTRRSATSIEPSGRPSCAADHRQHTRVGAWRSCRGITCANGRARPSQSRSVPDFSVTTPDRQHDVGPLGDLGVAGLQASTNGTASSAARKACGSGASAGSTPADDRTDPGRSAESGSPGSRRRLAASAPDRAGPGIAPARGRRLAHVRSTAATNPPGPARARRAGPRPRSPRPRRPARARSGPSADGPRAAVPAGLRPPGPRARRRAAAPRPAAAPVRTASAMAADSAPGTSAARSPTRITAPGAPAASAESPAARGQRGEDARLLARCGGQHVGAELGRSGRGERRHGEHL